MNILSTATYMPSFHPLRDHWHSWTIYAIVVTLYTLCVFCLSLQIEGTRGDALAQVDNRVFSKRNTQPVSLIVREHLMFLTFIVAVGLLISRIYPSLPDWLTFSRRGGKTGFDLLVVFALLILRFVERRRIYVEAIPCVSSDEDSAPTGQIRR